MPGTIVVGVDGSEGAERALRWAVEEAALRRAQLRVVHAWRVPLLEAAPEPFVLALPIPDAHLEAIGDAYRSRAAALLDDAVERAVDGDPGLELDRVLLEGPAAAELLRAAEDADLLVVGSRGRGGFAGLLLGSVGQHVAQHAPCPVVIVPASGGRR
jgi:nucleotide-binding universal stress UspA family protein